MPRAFLQFEPVVNTPWGNWRAKFFLQTRRAGNLFAYVSQPIPDPSIALPILELPTSDAI